VNRQRSEGKCEAQLHNLAQGSFNGQHGCDPGFTDVYGTTLQETASPRIDSDFNVNFVPGMATDIGNCSEKGSRGLLLGFR